MNVYVVLVECSLEDYFLVKARALYVLLVDFTEVLITLESQHIRCSQSRISLRRPARPRWKPMGVPMNVARGPPKGNLKNASTCYNPQCSTTYL